MRQALFTLAMMLASAALSPAYADMLVGQASVIDGDTIEIHGTRIRMAGIDAPESRQFCTNAVGDEYRCGKAAAFALADQIGRAIVTCEGSERDRYKRLVATCFVSGADLNAWMIEQGLAVAYRKYSKFYVPQEEAAKAAHTGIWQGAFEMPWNWRKTH